jgi:hypothetical protein
MFWKLDLFLSSGVRGNAYPVGYLRKSSPLVIEVALSKGLLTPEGGNRSSFENIVFYIAG